MRHSEFWECVDAVLGSEYGRSLVRDYYLLDFSGTAEQALARGVDPDAIWAALCREFELPASARWYHRKKAPRR